MAASDGWLFGIRSKFTSSATDLLISLGLSRKNELNRDTSSGALFYKTDEVGGTDVDLLAFGSPRPCLTEPMDGYRTSMVHTSGEYQETDNNVSTPENQDDPSDGSTPRASSPYPFEQLGLPMPFSEVDLADWDYDAHGGGDTLELQHFGTIKNLIPIGKSEIGKGHDFSVQSLVNPTWCDKCGDFIWGFFWQAVICKKCLYTCHLRCQQLVTLDCRSVCDSLKSNRTESTFLPDSAKDELSDDLISEPVTETTGLPPDDSDDDLDDLVETVDGVLPHLTAEFPRGEKLQCMIDDYNKYSSGLNMAMEEDGINFRGFLRVHMNFSRPINVVSGEVPPTLYDVMNPEETIGRKTITSFFLPRNTVKVLHLTSETSSQEMIVALLKKFKVADNPKKFALYERDLGPGDTLRAKLLRIPDDEYPLRLALRWGCYKRLVLQENESGDIAWEAFEIPELNNFLRILEREETLYIHQIRLKYEQYRRYVDLEMRTRGIANPAEYCGLHLQSSYNPHFSFNVGCVLPSAPPLSTPASDRSVVRSSELDVDDLTVDKTIKRFGGVSTDGLVVINGIRGLADGRSNPHGGGKDLPGCSNVSGGCGNDQFNLNGETTVVRARDGGGSNLEQFHRPYSTNLCGAEDGSMIINHKINQQFSWPPDAAAAPPDLSANGSMFDSEYYSDGTIKSNDGTPKINVNHGKLGGCMVGQPSNEEEQTDV